MLARHALGTKGAGASAERAMPAERPRILVVDDNAENRRLVEATLGDEDIDVVSAASGEEALEQFAAEPVDCVLLDVRMPGLDGFET
jgi:two-component system sensor histidine kinase/response regulator